MKFLALLLIFVSANAQAVVCTTKHKDGKTITASISEATGVKITVTEPNEKNPKKPNFLVNRTFQSDSLIISGGKPCMIPYERFPYISPTYSGFSDKSRFEAFIVYPCDPKLIGVKAVAVVSLIHREYSFKNLELQCSLQQF